MVITSGQPPVLLLVAGCRMSSGECRKYQRWILDFGQDSAVELRLDIRVGFRKTSLMKLELQSARQHSTRIQRSDGRVSDQKTHA